MPQTTLQGSKGHYNFTKVSASIQGQG